MTVDRRWCLLAVLVGMLTAVAIPAALAQDAAPAVDKAPAATEGKKLAELWGDLLHYIRVARFDIAKSYGQAILESKAKPREIYLLWARSKTAGADMTRALSDPGIKPIIEQLKKRIDEGYEAERADPVQIADAIDRLGKGLRAYEDALRRLLISGEYALPQLIEKLMNKETPAHLKQRIATALPRFGKQGVRGLSAALQTSDAHLQEMLANALREIGYRHGAPRLKELAERKDVLKRTRTAALRALVACAGEAALKKPAAELYYEAAQAYYAQDESVAPDPRYDTANVWRWKEGLGLTYRPVPRAIFCDIYAMRMARLALTHQSDFYPAVSLWLAANLKKQADLPEGAKDPTRPADQPKAGYYALASGAKYLQQVLARALSERNSTVAIWTIEALAQTSGAKNLVRALAGGVQPLVSALTYPDRHVRFLAAESLAMARPHQRFEGCQLVLPVLNEALRQTGAKRALLTAEDPKQRNVLKDAIRKAEYEVIDEPDPVKALAAARASGGVDVAVVGASPEPQTVVRLLRRDRSFTTLPVVVVGGALRYRGLAADDGRIVPIDPDAKTDQITKALADAAKLGVGTPFTAEQANAWAVRAAAAIRRLGLTANKVYDLNRSLKTLAEVLTTGADEVKVAAAQALAVLPEAEAQRAVVKLAANGQADEKVRIAAFRAASESVRACGNQLTEPLAGEVISVVAGKASLELRSAAAQLLGAMDLPSEKIKSLILATAGSD